MPSKLYFRLAQRVFPLIVESLTWSDPSPWFLVNLSRGNDGNCSGRAEGGACAASLAGLEVDSRLIVLHGDRPVDAGGT